MSTGAEARLKACLILGVAATLIVFAGCGREEPTGDAPPVEEAQEPVAPSNDEVIAAIEEHIQNEIAAKGGFEVEDPRSEETLMLSFGNVHESVQAMEGDLYSACVDLTDAEGNVYDVDVQLAFAEGEFAPDRILLHKVNGEAIGE